MLLAQFPLKLVVFPEEIINLHIFEPRYRELIKDCKEQNIPFGIPTISKQETLSWGTKVELIEISNSYSDGKLDIKCKGLEPYTIVEYYSPLDKKMYDGAEVTIQPFDSNFDLMLNKKIIDLINELYHFMNISKNINEDVTTFDPLLVAHKIGLTLSQEINLLRLPQASDRQDFILTHLEELLPSVKKMELLRKKIQMNGHFKNIS